MQTYALSEVFKELKSVVDPQNPNFMRKHIVMVLVPLMVVSFCQVLNHHDLFYFRDLGASVCSSIQQSGTIFSSEEASVTLDMLIRLPNSCEMRQAKALHATIVRSASAAGCQTILLLLQI